MEFSATYTSDIAAKANADTAALRAFRTELDEVSKALGKTGGLTPEKAKPKTGDDKSAAAAQKQVRAGIDNAGKLAKAQEAADKAEAKLLKEGEKKKDAIAKASKKRSDETGKALWSGAKMAAAAGAVALAGFAAMAPTAIGYAGMAKLNAITARATLNFRQLFKGVDASPLIRAYDKFTQNISKSAVTGRALGDVLTRSFNGVFSILEKVEPLATAAFQGMILGALWVEASLLKLEIAFAPAVVAIEDFAKSEDGLALATSAGKIAFAALVVGVTAAAAPILAVGAAIAAVSEALVQFQKLSAAWDDNSSSQIWSKFKNDIGVTSDAEYQKETDKRQGIVSGADKKSAAVPPGNPAAAKAVGNESGVALGDGLVAGMKSKEAAVTAAGGSLAKAADKGVKDAAQIHSPSRVMKEKGKFMGEGLEEGLDDSKAGVHASAAKNLNPDVKTGKAGSGTGKSGETHFHFSFPGLTSGNPEDIKDAVRQVFHEEVWKAFLQLGGSTT